MRQRADGPRRAARERGGPLPSIEVADALLDERRELTEQATTFVTLPEGTESLGDRTRLRIRLLVNSWDIYS
jgi:hypothetical protein